MSCRCRVAGAVRQTTAQANSPLESAESESAHDGLALRSVSRFDHITKSGAIMLSAGRILLLGLPFVE